MAANNVHMKRAGRRSGLRKTVIIAAVAAVTAAALFLGKPALENYLHNKEVSKAVNTNAFYSGIVVQGVDLGGKTMDQAAKAVDKSLNSDHYDIKITYNDKSWQLTEKDLSFSNDVDSVLKKAYSYARSGDMDERYKLVNALKTNPKKYTVAKKLNEDELKKKLSEITDSVSYSAREPQVTGFNFNTKAFSTQAGKAGLSVDTEKLLSGVENIINGAKTGSTELSVHTVNAKITLSQLRSRLKKLGTFSTVSTNSSAGTYNMSRALASVNKTCVKPGATFSFLNTVGSCDKAHGYLAGGAILNGKLVQQYGGGICQASTTVYGAALRSGMKITVRSNHSIPSSYCPIGQDATVSYPGIDLKFKNTSDYPVYIVTQTVNRTLTATFYGYMPPDYDTVKISSSIISTIPAPSSPKYVTDSTLPKGMARLSTKARTGYKVKAERVYYKSGKSVKTESLPSSYYKPQQAVYLYGKGTSLSSSEVTESSVHDASSNQQSNLNSEGGT